MSHVYLITVRGHVSTPWDGYTSGTGTDPDTGEPIEVRFPLNGRRYGKRVLKGVISATPDTRSVAEILEPWRRSVGAGDRGFVELEPASSPRRLLPLEWSAQHPIVDSLASVATFLDTSGATWWINGARVTGGTPESRRATWRAAALDAIGWNPAPATEAEMFAGVRELPRLALWHEVIASRHFRYGHHAYCEGASDISVRLFESGGFIVAALGGSYMRTEPPDPPSDAWAVQGARLLSALNLGLYIWTWADTFLGSNRAASGLALSSRAISEYVSEPAASIVGKIAAKPDFNEIAPP